MAIMQTDPLKGVAAPPRFVPRTRADHTGAEFRLGRRLIMGIKVRAVAALLTTVLASPLDHKVMRGVFNELRPAS